MLQQILRDMWVDPEILAELDETQKQTLFCKMREEQVRRWQIWDQKLSKEEIDRPKQKNGKKEVKFMHGEDGEPWVWVMGEHPSDKSIESILEEEARARALAQARQEAHQLRRSVEKELTHLIDYRPRDSLEQKFDLSPKNVESIEDALEIYCTVDELRQRIDALEPEVKMSEKKELDKLDKNDFDDMKIDLNKGALHFNFIEGKRDGLQELSLNSNGDGVSSRVQAWERRVAGARAGDILRGIKARRARSLRDTQLSAREDAAWREQERKAKEAEAAMRSIARAAREAHRRSADPPAPAPAGKPPNREAAVEWFRGQELPRGVGLGQDRKPVNWFHGLITRTEAEQLLSRCQPGSFLVRVSERVWGYALSYRAGAVGAAGAAGAVGAAGATGAAEAAGAAGGVGDARCKHYLVERVPGAAARYRLLGAAQQEHHTLADLIQYHRTVAITESGGELLAAPCAPAEPPAILQP